MQVGQAVCEKAACRLINDWATFWVGDVTQVAAVYLPFVLIAYVLETIGYFM